MLILEQFICCYLQPDKEYYLSFCLTVFKLYIFSLSSLSFPPVFMGGNLLSRALQMHAGECPESTVGIELGSRLARSIVWVICPISGKMKALSTVLWAPAVVSLITADTESEKEGERSVSKITCSIAAPLSTQMSLQLLFFLSSMCNDIRIILSCKAGERSSLKNLCCLQRLMTKRSSCGIFSCGSSSWIKVYLVFKHGCDDWLLSVFFHLH